MSTAPAETATDLLDELYEVVDGVIVEKPPTGAYEFELE